MVHRHYVNLGQYCNLSVFRDKHTQVHLLDEISPGARYELLMNYNVPIISCGDIDIE